MKPTLVRAFRQNCTRIAAKRHSTVGRGWSRKASGLPVTGTECRKKIQGEVELSRRTGREKSLAIIRESTREGSTNLFPTTRHLWPSFGSEGFQHAFVRHAEYYVDGAVPTNGIEKFSMFWRG